MLQAVPKHIFNRLLRVFQIISANYVATCSYVTQTQTINGAA